MRPFEGFKRRAVIVVVGDEEQARRQALQEAVDGKDVPNGTILEMKGIFARAVIPRRSALMLFPAKNYEKRLKTRKFDICHPNVKQKNNLTFDSCPLKLSIKIFCFKSRKGCCTALAITDTILT